MSLPSTTHTLYLPPLTYQDRATSTSALSSSQESVYSDIISISTNPGSHVTQPTPPNPPTPQEYIQVKVALAHSGHRWVILSVPATSITIGTYLDTDALGKGKVVRAEGRAEGSAGEFLVVKFQQEGHFYLLEVHECHVNLPRLAWDLGWNSVKDRVVRQWSRLTNRQRASGHV